ncbi:hypothetical protein HZA56_07110 [Candidatus Poribacteria bacterium]|nr:hypothetical protein [Candidatus Poribacteria bacterium]
METILGRLGSRFTLDFRPRERQVWASPLGRIFDRPLRLAILLQAGDRQFAWPFSPGEPPGLFEQEMTMTSLTFKCASEAVGIELLIKFTAPFYPQNERVSSAPFFYLDIACRPITPAQRSIAGEVKVALFAGDDEAITREDAGIVVRGMYRMSAEAPLEDADEFSRGEFAGSTALVPIRGKMALKENTFSIPYSVEKGTETRATFILAAHSAETVLKVNEALHRFRYLRWFPNLSAVAEFARRDERDNREMSLLFDNLFLRCSFGQSEKSLLAYSFQSHLATTWWTEPASGADSDWFGCWDKRGYHNTLESESVYGLLYLNLWPELLEKQLSQRALLEKITGVFPPHCGRFLSVRPAREQAAGVEQTSDFLLALFSHWRWWNRIELIHANASLIRRLANVVLRSDAAQVEHARARTSLVLKTLCALDATALMAEDFNDGDFSESCARTVRTMKAVFRERAWLEDHFSLSLTRETDPLVEQASGKDQVEWAEYCITTPIGLLHHLMCDYFPDLDPKLFVQDILSSAAKTLSDHGCVSAAEKPNKLSISLNICRDIAAAYFGLDFIRMAQRYWSLQTAANSSEAGSGYVDSPDFRRNLPDPRGAVAIGLCQALLGLKLDRIEGGLFVSPLSVPAEGPILPLADWQNRRTPWVSVKCEGSHMTAQVDARDLVENVGEFAIDPHPELKWGGA